MPSFPKSVLITGSNRGIGLGLVQQFLKHSEVEHVFATARDVQKAEKLNEIKDSRLHVLPLTVTDDKSIDTLVQSVSNIVGDNGLNLLVNNAGIAVKYSTSSKPTRGTIHQQFDTNTISLVITSQKFLPLLEKGVAKGLGANFTVSKGAIVNISSEIGSISEMTMGSGWLEGLAYAMSKTAVNQFTKIASIDLREKGILLAAFCPGWVKTAMGTENGLFTVEQSASSLVDSISKLTEKHNGGYYRNNLDVIPY